MPGAIVQDHDFDLTDRWAYDSSGNTEYWGKAPCGSAETDSVWKIKKFTYSSGQATKTEFPQDPTTGYPTSSFQFRWDQRASLTYG